MKNIYIPLFLILFSTITGSAKDISDFILIWELRSYFKENVVPVVSANRKKFDAGLSKTERLQITMLRERARKVFDERRENKVGFVDLMKSDELELSPKQKEVLQRSRKEIARVFVEAYHISQAHEASIADHLKQMAGQKEEWKKDIIEIIGKYKTEEEISRIEKISKLNVEEIFEPAAFVLWDPNAAFNLKSFSEKATVNFSISPNPASNKAQLEIELKKPMAYSVKISNQRGELYKTIIPPYPKSSKFSLPLNVDHWPEGTYFIQVMAGDSVSTKMLVKE